MPQAAARNLQTEESAVAPPEQQRAPEARERAESDVEKAVEGGSREKVVSIFKNRAAEEKQALERLGVLEPQESEAVPEAASRIEAANRQMEEKISAAEQSALSQVEALLGTPPAPAPAAVEAAPIEAPKAEVAPVPAPAVEAVKVMPTIAVGEVPKAEAVPAIEKTPEILEAEEQRHVAAEVIKENYDALSGFAKEHGLSMNEQAFTISDKDLTKLTRAERMYAQVLMGKHAAGQASLLHAEKVLQAAEFPEGDPKRAELMQEAESLAADATLKETGAQVMQQNYMNLPEIMALAGGGGDETGGSYGGQSFEPQASPFGGEPKGPEIPNGKVPGLYEGGGAPGSGLTKIEAYKTPDAKVEPRKPNFIERFFNRNAKDLGDWFKQFGGGEGGRE